MGVAGTSQCSCQLCILTQIHSVHVNQMDPYYRFLISEFPPKFVFAKLPNIMLMWHFSLVQQRRGKLSRIDGQSNDHDK